MGRAPCIGRLAAGAVITRSPWTCPNMVFTPPRCGTAATTWRGLFTARNQTVWLMKEEGFTAAEVEKVTVAARSGNQETPVTITSEQRAGTTDPLRHPGRRARGGHVRLPVSGGNGKRTDRDRLPGVPLPGPGNSLFWENYAVGFAFQMGDVLDFNDKHAI